MDSLTLLVFLPLLGALVVALTPREAVALQRGLTLATLLAVCVVGLVACVNFNGSSAEYQQVVVDPLVRAARRRRVVRAGALQARPGRALGADGRVDGAARADRDALDLGPHHHARQGVHDLAAGDAERDAGRLPRARHRALLRLLGADADPAVLHGGHLGRRAAPVRDDQVLPLHHGRIAGDAGRRDPADLPAQDGRRAGADRARGRARARRARPGSSGPSRWPS